MSRRVFVGIKISNGLQEEILGWEKSWQQKLTVRWLAGKNLHITLIPPWYEGNPEKVKNALGEIKGKFKPFEIKFNKITFGPDPKHPRLIWTEGKAPPEIFKLKKLLEKILNQAGEKRKFSLHLTLARFQPKDFLFFPIKTLDEEIAWAQEVYSIILFEAHLFLTGAEYEVLEEIKF